MAEHTVNSSYMGSGFENNTVHVKNGYKAATIITGRREKENGK